MNLFFKGLLVGTANIIPGVSGCALLVIFDLYKPCIESLCNIFKNPKDNIKYLFPIALGILIGTISFSNIIIFFLEKHEIITKFIFIGFITGTLPALLKNIKFTNIKIYFIFIAVGLILGLILLISYNNTSNIIITSYSLKGIGYLFIIGQIVAFSSIIPGISGTALLNMFGLYNVYITSIANFNIINLIIIFLSLLINGFIVAKIIKFLLEKYYSITFCLIIGFTISTLFSLIPKISNINITVILGIILGFSANILSNKLAK